MKYYDPSCLRGGNGSSGFAGITGISLPDDEFRVETVERLDTKSFLDLAQGRRVGLILPGFISQRDCERISENFARNPGKRQRQDGVPGETLGVDLYKATPSVYVEEVLKHRRHVEELFFGATNVPLKLQTAIQRIMPQGTAVRSASAFGIQFGSCRAVKWTDCGTHALKFHDDQGQLTDPGQARLETSRVKFPLALNVYPSTSEIGGGLVVYNIAPDDATRVELGLAYTGYPYPIDLLEGRFNKLTVTPKAGDLVILSGRFVHGVEGLGGSSPRILLNHFGGFIDPETFVTWS
jgi:hypothetical protein